MSIDAYYFLIDDLCARCNIADPLPMYGCADLQVRGVHFSMFYGDAVAPHSALLYTDFGEVAALNKELVLQRLMEANLYMFGLYAPSFCYNPQTQKIILSCLLPLEGNTASKVLDLLNHLADMAVDWKADYYLHENEKSENALGTDGAPVDRIAVLLRHLAGMDSSAVPEESTLAESAWALASAQEKEGDIYKTLHKSAPTSTSPT